MGWAPVLNVVLVSVARFVLPGRVTDPIEMPLSKNVRVPLFAELKCPVVEMDAYRVTICPYVVGFAFEYTLMRLAA
jgi:hypothetical protein